MMIRQGEHGDCAWLIQSGKLEIARRFPGTNAVRRLGVIGGGALVGEMALIAQAPRSACVRCMTDVVAVRLTRADFERMTRQSKPLAAWLLKSLVGAINGANGAASSGLTDRKSSDIRSGHGNQSVLDRRAFNAGHLFFEEGDPGDIAYLIQAGSVSIRRGEQELLVLGPGRIFGELALLRAKPRAATAVAVVPTACEVIRKTDFDAAIATMPPILRSVTHCYVERLTPTPLLEPAPGGAASSAGESDAAAATEEIPV